jgi:hypothetical protein
LIRNSLIVLLLFILCDGFCLLPEKYVVLPGVFRIRDSIFIILPVFFLFSLPNFFRAFYRFGEEAMWVLAACALVLISPLMADIFFGQSYLTGLLLIRHNLSYLTFFMFVLLLRPYDDLDRLLRLLSILMGLYIIALLLTKFFPGLELVHYQKGYYEEMGSAVRFGEFRLFFPYADFAVLLYCITLSRLLYAPKTDSGWRKFWEFAFILLVAYASLSTFTRILVFSLLPVTVFALFFSPRPLLRYAAIFMVLVFVSAHMLNLGWSSSGVSFIESSKLGKMLFKSSGLDEEVGRKFQLRVCMENFIKSPIVGVGTLASGKFSEDREAPMRTYRKFGFFLVGDLGYPRIAAEWGLLGLAWVIWFYWYLYRRSRETLAAALKRGDAPEAEAVARGMRYFLIFLFITGFTIPTFIYMEGIPVIILALALMAITRESMQPDRGNHTASGRQETHGPEGEEVCQTP